MTKRMRMLLALGALALTSACAGRVEETVEYDVYRMPVAGFAGLGFLGVAKPRDVDPKQWDHLVGLLDKCGQYQKVNKLGTTFALADGERDAVGKKLKSDVAGFQDARYVHGVLVIEPIRRKIDHETKETTHVTVKESVDHEWYDSYGYAAQPQSGHFAAEEIAPRAKLEPRRVALKGTTFELGLRYVLYNKAKDQIVFDRRTYIAAEVRNYSLAPAIADRNLEAALMRQLMGRIARQVCPKVASVERTLYAAKTDGKADQLVGEGVDLADDEQWDQAADRWKKAILIDKKSAYAYHDLGIYYERAGNIPAAMEEFEKAKHTGLKEYVPRQYDVSLSLFKPAVEPLALEPRVYAVSGANWVSLYGGRKGALAVGTEYPVYRLRRLGAAPDYRFNGVSLLEVGRVRIVKAESAFVLGRITQFADPARIEGGDVVVTGDL